MKTQNESPSRFQKTPKLWSRFISKKILPGLLSKSHAQNSPKSIPSNLYHHCSETPLDVFIDALVNNNHRRLIKSGSATPADIELAWQNLFYQYCDIAGTKSYRQLFAINKELGQLKSRLLTVYLCLKVLSVNHEPQCVSILHKLGYAYELNPENQEKYKNQLSTIEQKSRTIEIAIQEKEAEYKNALAEFGGKQATEEDFTKVLVELSSFMGFRLNPREITVSEYLAIHQKYEKEAQHAEMLKRKSIR